MTKRSSTSSNRRELAQEMAVSMVFDGSSSGVLMATPQDIRDLAYGFALSEGFIQDPSQVESFEEITHKGGIEARFWLKDSSSQVLKERRRLWAGPVGCGLCGIDSLEQANRKVPDVAAASQAVTFSKAELSGASDLLKGNQPLHDKTGAMHGAGFLIPKHGMILAREDVGRHNALDKLIGALASREIAPSTGAFVLTSRLSQDLIQKAAMVGCGTVIAVSAPTQIAVELAQSCGMNLIGMARAGKFETFA